MSKLQKTAVRKISVTQVMFIGFIAIAGLVGLGWLMNRLNFESWDFRNNLWAPVSLLVEGKSPYNIQPLNPEGKAVWFPIVIGLFFPFGWLPFSYASVLWLVLNIGLVIALVVLAAHGEKPRIIPFTLGLLVIFLHPRIIAHLQLGQYTIFATTLFLFAAYAVSKEKILLTSVLVAIALAKPQLGFLIVPGIAVACFRWYGSKQAASYFLYLLGVTVLFSVPLFIGYWNWIPDFIKTLQENPGWAQPSLVSILQGQMGLSGLLIWLILAIVFSLLNGWIWYRLLPSDAIYWSLALTPLITPYVWSWDFVMLMPLFVRTLYELRRIPSYLVLLGGYGVIWWLMFQVIMQTSGDDQYFIWVSWATFLLILVALALEKMMGEHPALTVNFQKVATG